MPLVHTDSVAAAADALAGAPSPIVVVPVYNGFEDAARCYESLLAHTPVDTALLVVDDRGADRRPIDLLDQIADRVAHLVVVLHRPVNGGFVGACNDAFDATSGRDLIVVNSDVVVGPEWSSRLTEAACSSSLIATASALTNHGTILSVPHRNRPDDRLPGGMTPEEAARRVAEASLQLRPTIPTAIGHCFYVKRALLDLVGGFDEAFGRGYGEEVDLSQRAVMAGFRHVCADDVFVFHRGGVSFGAGATAEQQANEAVVNARYPWYRHWVVRASTDHRSTLAHALQRASSALIGTTIGIDAMCLGPFWAGTQSVTLETTLALARVHSDREIVVFHSPAITSDVAAVIDANHNIRRTCVDDIKALTAPRVDVLYRPYQVNSVDELRWLRVHGRRVIVNQLDVIAWSNPSYFTSDHAWLSQRELTRLVLDSVDGVAFISESARRETIAEGMVPEHVATRVVYCGTTSVFHHGGVDEVMPRGFVDDGRPFMIALGASYHHKQRVFSMRLLGELRRRGWDGRLVLAGPTPPRGNSLAFEAVTRLLDPDVGANTVSLGDLTEAQKLWLYRRASLCLYPTSSEGFGLIPFEAAAHGVATLSSRQASLDEVLPADIATLHGYSVETAADTAMTLLTDLDAAKQLNSSIESHAADFTWERTAREVLALVDEVMLRPPNRTAASWGEGPAPMNLDVRNEPRTSAIGVFVDRQLRRLLGAERLKRTAVPEGSRRQELARRGANWARRRGQG